jgi:uncharacterized YigZ family protein
VDEARQFITRIRQEFSDASHNVPLFVIGHGASTISHCSDDGEPAGTAGKPALAVLKGSGIGNISIVISRYFGGTKLGTGGLVKAYSDAVRELLRVLPQAVICEIKTLLMEIPYPLYDHTRFLIKKHNGNIVESDFSTQIILKVEFFLEDYEGFSFELKELIHRELIINTSIGKKIITLD